MLASPPAAQPGSSWNGGLGVAFLSAVFGDRTGRLRAVIRALVLAAGIRGQLTCEPIDAVGWGSRVAGNARSPTSARSRGTTTAARPHGGGSSESER